MSTVTDATLGSVLLAETDHQVAGDHPVGAGHRVGVGRRLVVDDHHHLVVTGRRFAADHHSAVVEGMACCFPSPLLVLLFA